MTLRIRLVEHHYTVEKRYARARAASLFLNKQSFLEDCILYYIILYDKNVRAITINIVQNTEWK